MSSPWDGQKITSPATRFIRSTCDPYGFWLNQLKRVWPSADEDDASSFWNLLSAIYALTEEEKVKLRATDAYAFAGGSTTTGKRKLVALINAGLVLTAKNPSRRNEKFVVISEEARGAVLRTLDEWASYFEADTAAYRRYRSSSMPRHAHH
ncbi:hypothetical protein [Rhodoblastus sp.]|jgi:hypothetical protein|uniref:hypothetical protein n=1 Tax=Rhodoblastus sp. TaxID=1962975 RepID=UPI00260F7C3A|nr:hypothetical protein [Rhodoblastus sp.]